MKILHALVGYLAVISLPFPFAFASPLEIHYDGYVNSTNYNGALMEHFLGTIAETCQTVNMNRKNHSDGALMKRVPGDIQVIEARQEGIAPLGLLPQIAIVTAVLGTVALPLVWIASDKPVRCNVVFFPLKTLIKVFCQKREAFTENTINQMMWKWPHLNWVICHSPYSIGFDGVEGTDYAHTHYELPISFGRTIGSVHLTYLQYIFSYNLANTAADMIFIGQSPEHSIDMEMEDLKMYVPHLSNLRL